jgi:conjugative transposon TraM protein
VVLLPLLFLGYTLMKTFNGGPSKNANVVRDSINMSLPEAAETRMADKMTSMNSRYDDHGGLTAVGGIGDDQEQKDSVGDAYLSHEAEVARQNAELARQQQMLDEQQRRLENSRRMAGGYASYGSSGTSRQAEMDEYRRDLEDIQRRSLERQRIIQEALAPEDTRENSPGHGEESGKIKGGKPAKPKKETLLVTKLQDANAGSFNTVAMTAEKAESMLIRAMIDKTTKAHEGTRLRFKLLDDVQIKDTKLKRGTYLYGTVTGFGQQRVRASITSILVGDKFLNVSLSVYDNDGMEGFYVPESAFRDMMREAGAQSLQGNINLNDGYSSELTGEAVALQALQNMYQSATSAVSANIRKNKARIKYNTIVYLINTENRE